MHLKLKVCSDKQTFSGRALECALSAQRICLCAYVFVVQFAASYKVQSRACCAGRKQDQHHQVCCHSNHHSHDAIVQQKGPTISRLDPALQHQWDHAGNAHLGPVDITPKNGRKVWWMCDQCPDGHLHRWEATVAHRSYGSGCPQCCGRKVCKHNSLATKAPLIAAQWDYEENDGTPDHVVAHSSQPVAWHCEVCGHKWTVTPDHRLSKKQAGCPKCAKANSSGKKKIKHPTFAEWQDRQGKALLAEWDHERNVPQGNFPHNTTVRSGKQIFWICTECPAGQPHSWAAQPYQRTDRNKSGCPFCAGKAACRCNSLQALYPDVAAEWDQAKNQGQPSDYTASSNRLAWWFSPERGSWQLPISSRTDQRLIRNR